MKRHSITVKAREDLFKFNKQLKIYSFIVDDFSHAVCKVNITVLNEEILSFVKNNLPENIQEIGDISLWRDLYRNMGIKASKYLSSIEALVKRAKKNNWLTGINFVDFYNYYSIKNIAPIGGYDLDKITEQSIDIRFANHETDSFDPLGADSDKYQITDNQIVYATGAEIVCWAVNHRDSKKFCLEPKTKSAIFFSESLQDTNTNSYVALQQFSECLRSYGSNVTDIACLSNMNRKLYFELKQI